MKHYQTIVEALEDLKSRGFDLDFNLKPDCIECPARQLRLHPEDFQIQEVYRFEGMSNPDDNSVVYAIQSSDGIKGILIDAYGAYAEALTPEMAAKMKSPGSNL